MALYERAVGGRRTTVAEPVSLRLLGVGPLVTAGLFGWLGLRSANPWLLLLACACGSPLVVAWLARPRLDTIALRWTAPYRCVVGETVEHRYEVENVGRRATPAARIVHTATGFDEVAVLVPALPPGGRASLPLSRQARARTVTVQHRVVVVSAAPLGLVEHRRSWVMRSPFVVHPAPTPPVPILAGGGDGEAPAGAPARTGTEVHASREWRPGDDRRHVHWRSTARHGRLVVVEPERTIARRLAVVVGGQPGAPEWEPLLARAAWTVVAALREGREVRLVVEDAAIAVDLVDADVVTTDPVTALDWFAGLRDPQAPGRAALDRAAAWAGPGADVVLVATRTPALTASPRWDGVRVVALDSPDGAPRALDPQVAS